LTSFLISSALTSPLNVIIMWNSEQVREEDDGYLADVSDLDGGGPCVTPSTTSLGTEGRVTEPSMTRSTANEASNCSDAITDAAR
jgi:hypothetical protein